jgi:hypothetical protein
MKFIKNLRVLKTSSGGNYGGLMERHVHVNIRQCFSVVLFVINSDNFLARSVILVLTFKVVVFCYRKAQA